MVALPTTDLTVEEMADQVADAVLAPWLSTSAVARRDLASDLSSSVTSRWAEGIHLLPPMEGAPHPARPVPFDNRLRGTATHAMKPQVRTAVPTHCVTNAARKRGQPG